MKLGFGSKFIRKASTVALALLGAALLQPAAAHAIPLTMTLSASTSQVFLGAGSAEYSSAPTPISTLDLTLTGNTLSFDNFLVHQVSVSSVGYYEFTVLGPVTGMLDAVTGEYSTNPFSIRAQRYQVGTGIIANQVFDLENIVLTTETTFRDCQNNSNDFTADGSRLGALAPNFISLVGSACPFDPAPGDFANDDAKFFIRLQGFIPIEVPEPATGLLIGVALFAVAIPRRMRNK